MARKQKVHEFRKPKRTTGKGNVMSPKTVRALNLEWQIFDMRRDGHTIHEIAVELGVSDPTVSEHLKRVLDRTVSEIAESADQNRQLQIDRLDKLLKKYMPMAQDGNMGAASLVLTIEARRSKLLALDVPETKRVDVTGIREYVGIDVEAV